MLRLRVERLFVSHGKMTCVQLLEIRKDNIVIQPYLDGFVLVRVVFEMGTLSLSYRWLEFDRRTQ